MSKYAYAYFDTVGRLREFILDPSVRQGNEKINKIYIYWDHPEDFNTMTVNWVNTDDLNPEWSQPQLVDSTEVNFQVQPIQDYDPTFFKYGQTYPGYLIDIPQDALSEGGNIALSLAVYNVNNEVIMYLGLISLFIENSGAQYQPKITKSEYWTLMNSIVSENQVKALIAEAELPEATIGGPIEEGSPNVVTSGTIYNALIGKENLSNKKQVINNSESEYPSSAAVYPVKYLSVDEEEIVSELPIAQEEANASVTFTITDSSGGVLTRFGNPYTALKVINGVMWIIGEIVLENNTSDAVNNVQVQFYGTVPQKYRRKIKRLDGTNLTQDAQGGGIKNLVICTTVMAVGSNEFKRVFLEGANGGQVNVSVTCDFPANDYRVLSIRIPLILL